jgi:hypothetical protein
MSLFLYLRYINIILTCILVGTYLIFKFQFINSFVSRLSPNKEDKLKIIENYRHALNTIFRIIVGILLISFQFPFLYKYFFKNSNLNLENYGNEVAPIIAAAGVIVLFTVSKQDVIKTINFAKDKLIF